MRAATANIRQSGTSVQILAAIGVAIMLHYAITPAESGGSGLALHLRFAVAVLGGAIVLFANLDLAPVQRLALPLCMLAVWILLQNFPTTTWYAVMFAGFAMSTVVMSSAFVVGPLKQRFLLALDMMLLFWVGIFVSQFLIYFGAGAIIDFHGLLHPYSEARIHAEGDSGVFRLTGPHIEPGSYSNWVYGVVILRSLVRRKWFDLIGMAAVASTVLSFSLWAMLGTAAYFFGAIFQALSTFRLGTLIRLVLALLFFMGVFSYFAGTIAAEVVDYLALRADPDDGSSNSKLLAWQGFAREFWQVLAIGTSFEHDYCDGCASPQDAGLAINMVMRIGLLATLVVMFPIARTLLRTGGFAALIAFLPLLFAKFYVFDPVFWLIFGVCLLDGYRSAPLPRSSHRPLHA